MGRLPRAVEEQGKRADELLKQFITQDPSLAAPVTPGITDKTAPPITPAPVTPDSDYIDPAFLADPQHPPTPATPEPVTPAPVTPVPPDDSNSETWKSRYLVLEGKYRVEVPRLHGQLSYFKNQVTDLRSQIASLQINPGASLSNEKVPVSSVTTNFSDMLKTSEDPSLKGFRENFPDVAGPIGKLFDEFGSQILKKADDRVAAIEKTSTDSKQEAYVREITGTHPDWQTVCQGDPQWPTWLNTDNGYGVTRLDALRKANANFDSKVVIKLLTDFKKETGLASAQPSTPVSDPRARQVTPSSGPTTQAATAAAQNQGPESVARSFISQFAIDVARGKYRGKEAERDAIQAKIDAAVSAGKVLNK